MCELCDGSFEHIAKIEVGRAALLAQRVNPYGAMHIIVEDTNVDDADIEFCLSQNDVNQRDTEFAAAFSALNCCERISALALANNQCGASAIR